jgi:hypothetical protein
MKRSLMFIALVALLASVPASASTFAAMSDEALVAGSQAVIVGDIDQVYSFWNEDGTAVMTDAVVHVDRVLAGSAPARVTVRTFGGQVGDYRLVAEGFPTFQQGEHTVLFLSAGTDGTYRVTGYQLGQYRVRPGADGVATAFPALEGGIRLLYKDGTAAPAPKALPLEALANRVRRLAADRPTDPRVK